MSDELTNEALADLGFLVGDWEMSLSNASFLPDPGQVIPGFMLVSAIESGMLLVMRQRSEAGGTPLASWLIGRDASKPGYTVLYTDQRGVSRVYEMSLDSNTWTIWRDDAEFSQRFEATLSDDRQRIEGRWQKRSAGGEWEHDFDLSYARR